MRLDPIDAFGKKDGLIIIHFSQFGSLGGLAMSSHYTLTKLVCFFKPFFYSHARLKDIFSHRRSPPKESGPSDAYGAQVPSVEAVPFVSSSQDIHSAAPALQSSLFLLNTSSLVITDQDLSTRKLGIHK